MKKILRIIFIIAMLAGITLSVLNFISVDNTAMQKSSPLGTADDDGNCVGEPLNC